MLIEHCSIYYNVKTKEATGKMQKLINVSF